MLERLGCGYVADGMDDLTAFYHIPAVKFVIRVCVDVPARRPAAAMQLPATPCSQILQPRAPSPRPRAPSLQPRSPGQRLCVSQVLLAVLYVLTVVVSKTYAQLEVAEVVPEYHWLELCLYFVAVSIMLDSYYQHLVSSK